MLGGGDRPPLLALRASALRRRAQTKRSWRNGSSALRESYGRVQLHRPGGEQHRLFLASLPAASLPLARVQGAPVARPAWGDGAARDQPRRLTRSAPISATPWAARARRSSSTSPRPASRNRPPTCLLAGSLGSGKTICLELAVWQAFLQGSGPIVDIDPKGDHRLERCPASPGRSRRSSSPARSATAACSTRCGSVPSRPARTSPTTSWSRSCRRRSSRSGRRSCAWRSPRPRARARRSCGEVLARMSRLAQRRGGRGGARRSRRTAPAGSPSSASAPARAGSAEVGDAQVVSLRIRNLTLPLAGTARSELLEEERISLAVLRLLASYALRLCATDPGATRCWRWMRPGRSCPTPRGGRSWSGSPAWGAARTSPRSWRPRCSATPSELEPLVGALFAFGVETEAEAQKALALLRLDPDDEAAIQRLIGYRAGRCYFRDFAGQVAPIQIDPPPWLLGELDTTPRRADSKDPAGATPTIATRPAMRRLDRSPLPSSSRGEQSTAPFLPRLFSSKLCRCHHESVALGPPSLRAVERHHPAAEKARQRHVLSVIRAAPAEFLPQPIRRALTRARGRLKQVAFNCILGAGNSCDTPPARCSTSSSPNLVIAMMFPRDVLNCVGRWVRRSFFDSRRVWNPAQQVP